jgi:hypothetical protein
MRFTSLILLSLLTTWSVVPAQAQQQYFAHHYGGPGTIYLYNSVFGFNQDSLLLQSGPDLTWDLSNTDTLTHTTRIVAKEQAIDYLTYITICSSLGGHDVFDCGNIWNNTDQAWLNIDTLTLFQFSLTNSQRFQKRTNTRLFENFLGFTADIGGGSMNAVVVYSNPDTILHFPVTYGESFTSSIHWQIDLSPIGQNVQYQSYQTRATTIDAWGDVITPLQTFENVVRMRSVIHREDKLTSDSTMIPVNVTQVEYMWFDTSYKLPVMIAIGILTDTSEILSSIQYLWDKTCAVPTWSASVGSDTYTIDSTGSVTVTFTIENSNADEYAWDWGDGQLDTTSGSTTHTYSQPGVYEVGLTACMTDCLPLNSCSYDILEFEILTGIETIPGEKAGIRIYPNPVVSQVNLFLPQDLGPSQFTIMDMNGKQVISGALSVGNNHIDSAELAEGIYAVKILPGDPTTQHHYVLRFIVLK